MSRISKMMVALVACGFMAASTRATFEIVSNPHNMVIVHHEGPTSAWGGWSDDTLEKAYEAGQVTLSDSGSGYSGTPELMVDGATDDWTVSATSGYECYFGGIVDFKLGSSYTGGRTIGDNNAQNAMRLKTNFHLDHDGFHYRLEYSTTADPTVFLMLVEVKDSAPIEWSPRMTTFDFDANSTLFNGVDTIRYVQLATNHQGMVEEFNVSFVPGISAGEKALFAAAPSVGWTGTTGTVDWTVGSYITIGEAPVSVTALGYVDLGVAGLSDSHSVGIYDAAHVLIASETVSAGSVDPLVNGWRYVELSSAVELTAGATYLIVGDTGDSTDLIGYVPATDTDEPIPTTGSGVEVPDLDGPGIGYAGVSAAGDLARVYATSGGGGLGYPTIVRDGAWNAVNMQYDILPMQATIVGWSITNDMMRLVVDAPSAEGSYLKAKDNLVSGTWEGMAHSDDGANPFYVTNLTYSTLEGSNKVIYVDATGPLSFFGIGR